jgi:hypothetical protein
MSSSSCDELQIKLKSSDVSRAISCHINLHADHRVGFGVQNLSFLHPLKGKTEVLSRLFG